MDMLWFVIWMCAIAVAYMMAQKQGRETGWAIVGGLLFGWFCPLYYLLTKSTWERSKKVDELEKKLADLEKKNV